MTDTPGKGSVRSAAQLSGRWPAGKAGVRKALCGCVTGAGKLSPKPSWETQQTESGASLACAAPPVPLPAVVGGSLAGVLAAVALSAATAYLLLRRRRRRQTSGKAGDFEALGGTGGTGASTASTAISDELRQAAFHINPKDIVFQEDERDRGPVLLGKGSFGEARAWKSIPCRCLACKTYA